MTILGIGALGVGLFPGNTRAPHAIFAMVTFIAGGVSRGQCGPRHDGAISAEISFVLGAVSLLTLDLVHPPRRQQPNGRDVGIGGIERWIVYPGDPVGDRLRGLSVRTRGRWMEHAGATCKARPMRTGSSIELSR